MYPGNFLRLVVAGAGDGQERWSWSLALNTFDQSSDEPNVDAVPAAVVSAVEAFHQATSSSRAKLDSIKLNEIGPNGRYVRPITVEKQYATSERVSGGANFDNYPAQVALAVTLRTDVRRGPASRGRFYIPYPGQPIGGDGLISAAVQDTAAGYCKTLLDQLNAAGGWDVCVASDVGTGAFRRVMTVELGRRFDVIRSRGASLPESYLSKVLIPT